jgi:hypothetical protein
VVDAALQAFDIGGVDEEFAAVWFEEGDGLYTDVSVTVLGCGGRRE